MPTISGGKENLVALTPQDHVRIENLKIQGSMPGTERYLRVFRFGEPEARPKVYLQAGLHGGEIPGMLVLHRLAKKLKAAATQGHLIGEVIIVPVCNPIGVSQLVQGELVGRFNLSSGQNFNRRFPSPELQFDALADQLGEDGETNSRLAREAALSALDDIAPRDELESMQLHQLRLALEADYVLDLHCDGESLLHLYCSENGYEDFELLANQMNAAAMLIGSDASSGCLDERINDLWDEVSTSFPEHSFSRQTRAATLELRGRADVDLQLADQDADDIYKALQGWSVISGASGSAHRLDVRPTRLDALYSARTSFAGVVIYHKALGEHCNAGDLVASIIDPNAPFDTALERLETPVSGVLFSRNNIKLVATNTVVFKLAGEQSIDQPSGHSRLEE